MLGEAVDMVGGTARSVNTGTIGGNICNGCYILPILDDMWI